MSEYTPGQIPTKSEDIPSFLSRELHRISEALRLLETTGVHFAVQYTDVPKPREGLVVLSDAGVLGSLAGLYRYTSGSWDRIG